MGWGLRKFVRVRLAEFIRPKQIKIWLCEVRALYPLGIQGNIDPYPRATQLKLSHILPIAL